MNIIRDIPALKAALLPEKHRRKIALVPTMGNLHAGHLELVRVAKEVADRVVVSIFVNPLQFGPTEDFAEYPRTLQADIEKLSTLNVDSVFTPNAEEMGADLTSHTTVCVPKIADQYCGQFRPTFFYGVATVVAKLFNLVQPDIALFGEKDFQQLHIIQKMVHDLAFPLTILPVPTVRETDGLAMSSRNQYLNPEERRFAPRVYQTLCQMKEQLLIGEKSHALLLEEATRALSELSFKVDYLHICHKQTLALAHPSDQDLVLLAAAWLGKTRLIDNLFVTLDTPQ